VNHDGFVDVAAAYRFSNNADIFLNDGGQNFLPEIRLSSTPFASVHDVFFIDANADGLADVGLVNESGSLAILAHDGNLADPGFSFLTLLQPSALSAVAADLNGDGLDDVATVGSSSGRVFLNDPANPGTFQQADLPDAVGTMYDIEPGDLDLDGAVDLVGASITTFAPDTVRVWLNNGDGTFTNATSPGAGALLPGVGPYQRLSTELLDFDLDGDLDFYLTGADGSGAFGFGMVANQFWENDLFGLTLALSGACPGAVTLGVERAAAEGQVAVFGGNGTGSSTVPFGACAGTELDLDVANPLTVLTTDVDGAASVGGNLGEPLCGRLLQAVDLADCTVSLAQPIP
jgi:hypothetical protein